MNYKEIVELIKLVSKSDLREVKIKDGDKELVIRTDKYSARQEGYSIAPPASVMPQYPVHTPAATTASSTPPSDDAAPQTGTPEAPANTGLLQIKSPMVGTFYRSSAPDKPSYVKIGDKISKGTVVCIVEAMKLFNEIESEISGTIVQVLVEDGSPVEYDQVLFVVDPA